MYYYYYYLLIIIKFEWYIIKILMKIIENINKYSKIIKNATFTTI